MKQQSSTTPEYILETSERTAPMVKQLACLTRNWLQVEVDLVQLHQELGMVMSCLENISEKFENLASSLQER